MSRFKDLAGQRFHQLTAVGPAAEGPRNGYILWICRCDCGNTVKVQSGHLRSGNTKSCGCRRVEKTREQGRKKKHGMTGSPEYKAWQGMRERCYKSTQHNYHRYGGRGITVCDRWKNSFLHFYQDMGKRPSPEHSIDRRDNDGNYEPGNCRWATPVEQGNNRSTNVRHLVNEHAITIAQLARQLEIPVSTLDARLRYGYTVEEAIVKKAPKQLYTHNGETKNIADWATHYGMTYSKLYSRLVTMGWSFERSIQ